MRAGGRTRRVAEARTEIGSAAPRGAERPRDTPMTEREELLATLQAYGQVQQAAWPALNPTLAADQAGWERLDDAGLRAAIARYVAESEAPGNEVRLFWKVGPDLVFRGGNVQLARDAGLRAVSEMLGKSDFDPLFPWNAQAAKYRKDDLEIVNSKQAKLDIIERQKSDAGLAWLRTSKAPIVLASGESVGLLGMYGVIDRETAAKLQR